MTILGLFKLIERFARDPYLEKVLRMWWITFKLLTNIHGRVIISSDQSMMVITSRGADPKKSRTREVEIIVNYN